MGNMAPFLTCGGSSITLQGGCLILLSLIAMGHALFRRRAPEGWNNNSVGMFTWLERYVPFPLSKNGYLFLVCALTLWCLITYFSISISGVKLSNRYTVDVLLSAFIGPIVYILPPTKWVAKKAASLHPKRPPGAGY